MRRTQLVEALLFCAVISLPRIGSAQSAAPTPSTNGAGPVPLVVEDSGSPYTTALGYQALASNDNTNGIANTATGYQALFHNTGGAKNTASGFQALYSNVVGDGNTASGFGALYSNILGANNTACGYVALVNNMRGSDNTASGFEALYSNTTGSYNTALGDAAGSNATTGSYNLFLGAGVNGTAVDTNTIRIGLPYDGTNGQNQTFIAGIYGTQITNGLPVVVDANGQLGIAALPVTFIGPPGGSGNEPPAMVAQLQQQVRDLQTTNADLQARLARVESLLTNAAAASGK